MTLPVRVSSYFPVTQVILFCLCYCSRDLKWKLEFYVIFPLSSWTAALLHQGAGGSLSCGTAWRGIFGCIWCRETTPSNMGSSWNPTGMERGGRARNPLELEAAEGYKNCSRSSSSAASSISCPPGVGAARSVTQAMEGLSAHGSAAVYPLAGMNRLRSGITAGFVQTRRGEAEGGLGAGNTGCKHGTFHARTTRSWVIQSHRRGASGATGREPRARVERSFHNK